MRKFLLIAALAGGFAAAGAALPNRAEAMAIAPAALAQAGQSNVTDVAYVCRRWGRWHRSCYWRPGPAYGYGYGYGYGYRPYAYYGWRRPYYRRRWW